MIYLDNAATTCMHQSVVSAMLPYLSEAFGNPSSTHASGRTAARGIDDARSTVAAHLGAQAREVFFCSGGTEANNQALRTGVEWGATRKRNRVVVSAIEHPSVLRCAQALEREGIRLTMIAPTPEGIIEADAIASQLDDDVCLVSVMTINNEIGTIQPIRQIAHIAHDAGALFHTDAVQAAGHIPFDLHGFDIDLASFSAHKLHGPKGTGALLCSATAFDEPLEPAVLVYGGGQERGLRAGTLNVAGIMGFSAALTEAAHSMKETTQHTERLRDALLGGLQNIAGCHILGSDDRMKQSPTIVCVCFEDIDRTSLVVLLDREGICVSAGSACSAGAIEPSHVLTAMDVAPHIARGALRISLSGDTTMSDIKVACVSITQCVEKLRASAQIPVS